MNGLPKATRIYLIEVHAQGLDAVAKRYSRNPGVEIKTLGRVTSDTKYWIFPSFFESIAEIRSQH